ncbi:MAG: cytochrome c [Nitriliruptorales bacterium]|nr:cytochrome c [Nitriliruptorales bacterium]
MQVLLGRLLAFFGLVFLVASCAGGTSAEVSGDVARGGELFQANCAACHGVEGTGTVSGPPLVHEYYVPSHHPDAAFRSAVAAGVRPHHWDFGPMPRIEGISDADVADIIAYVRQLQREAGLID